MDLVATKVYLDRRQRRVLRARARRWGSSVSQEVRTAVAHYMAAGGPADSEMLARLAREAGEAIDRTLRRMDKALAYVAKTTAGAEKP